MRGQDTPTGAEQRCWNHTITNVLNDLPKTAFFMSESLNRHFSARPPQRHIADL